MELLFGTCGSTSFARETTLHSEKLTTSSGALSSNISKNSYTTSRHNLPQELSKAARCVQQMVSFSSLAMQLALTDVHPCIFLSFRHTDAVLGPTGPLSQRRLNTFQVRLSEKEVQVRLRRRRSISTLTSCAL